MPLLLFQLDDVTISYALRIKARDGGRTPKRGWKNVGLPSIRGVIFGNFGGQIFPPITLLFFPADSGFHGESVTGKDGIKLKA